MATNLQLKVWSAIDKIPKGRVTTYKELAKAINSKAIRVVATAVGKNPNAPQTPCHRVVLSSGKIGNYTHKDGIKRKIELLKSEGVEIDELSNIVDFENRVYRFNF